MKIDFKKILASILQKLDDAGITSAVVAALEGAKLIDNSDDKWIDNTDGKWIEKSSGDYIPKEKVNEINEKHRTAMEKRDTEMDTLQKSAYSLSYQTWLTWRRIKAFDKVVNSRRRYYMLGQGIRALLHFGAKLKDLLREIPASKNQ